jgi:GST-like protein
MLKFYYNKAPNPMKVALFLEETGLPYDAIPVDTMKGEQHGEAFRRINPNAKVPAIVDEGRRVFDSNAILLYLADKTGVLHGRPEDRGELLSWLMWIASGLGPFSGQCVHFRHMAPEKPPYAVNRYQREVERHYRVLDDHLKGREWIVGKGYSIADIAAWGWIDRYARVLGDNALDAYPNLKAWYQRVNARPAVERARKIGQDHSWKTDLDDEARRAMFPSNYVA